jgi:hypothetical protein
MEPIKDSYEMLMLSIRHTRKALERFTEASADIRTKTQLEQEYLEFAHSVQEFAQYQYGLRTTTRQP